MQAAISVRSDDVLLVVDPQNDFCPGGNLAVPQGDEIIPSLNRLAQNFTNVVLTQDWHPAGHASFASSHPGRKPYDTVELAYGTQILWPDHCVQASAGAAFRADLAISHAALILRKGFHHDIDSYSAFYENDRATSTGLAGYLRARGLTRIFIAGLAFDFCVRYSAEDACAAGYPTFVVSDACRGIDLDDSIEKAREAMAASGAQLITSRDLL
ncbi:MAG: bifunctional nicotinamidase/pyrazinamidase [Beijerinckiaceae bacterium]